MAYYAPKLFSYYVRTLRKLYASDPDIQPPFDGSIFPNHSPNTSSRATAYMHNDHANLAFGWCGLSSLGDFDHTKGGHLILQQLGVVVEFPPGSTILLPSATVTHGNTPISPHEKRASLVHYAAGGLFRWVEYGMRSWKTLKAEDPEEAARLWKERRNTRLSFALSLFSKVDELVADHAEVYS